MEKYKEFLDTSDMPAERYLQINSCGYQTAARRDYTILRSRGRGDYHLLYVQSGWIYAEVGETRVLADEGKCLVFYPHVRQQYTFTAEGSARSYWLHFTGTAIREVFDSVGLQGCPVYELGDRTVFEGLFHQLVHVHNMKGPQYTLDENGILLQLLAALARSAITSTETDHGAIRSSAAYICEHFQEAIDLEECAERLHLSLSRFAHLFTETIGVSPHRYLLRLRMDKAKELLLYSSMRVGEIAESVGFTDALYFSRIFRRYTGCSPSELRNKFSVSGGR